ncbi:dephospho-CoA kinase [Alteromonas sp.]|uniref:dephospho-CoA kinase n=1 Tax=Alteromonas sp. TaxID=232 RepID=UPI000B662FE1|nr:dephospho-CoA kinase [Alteromonas sp.]MAI38939.1 dephospho-CoA kinase [Alteromonas sp.]OUX84904.1 MAG: dephospho-CoA kinase [Alteromonas sp. TMED35]
MNNTFVVGLTGGIGSGKSAATDLFKTHGIDVVDADEVARDVVLPGTTGLQSIVERFGDSVLLSDGTLDRAQLRKLVFTDSTAKNWLNSLLHPLIRERMQQLIVESSSAYCILSVPLLVENKLTTMCNKVVVVDCSESTQLTRAVERDSSDVETIKNIMDAQATREERLNAADYVLDNNSSLLSLEQQVADLHHQLLAQASNTPSS